MCVLATSENIARPGVETRADRRANHGRTRIARASAVASIRGVAKTRAADLTERRERIGAEAGERVTDARLVTDARGCANHRRRAATDAGAVADVNRRARVLIAGREARIAFIDVSWITFARCWIAYVRWCAHVRFTLNLAVGNAFSSAVARAAQRAKIVADCAIVAERRRSRGARARLRIAIARIEARIDREARLRKTNDANTVVAPIGLARVLNITAKRVVGRRRSRTVTGQRIANALARARRRVTSGANDRDSRLTNPRVTRRSLRAKIVLVLNAFGAVGPVDLDASARLRITAERDLARIRGRKARLRAARTDANASAVARERRAEFALVVRLARVARRHVHATTRLVIEEALIRIQFARLRATARKVARFEDASAVGFPTDFA